MLPFIDETAVYNALDFSLATGAADGNGVCTGPSGGIQTAVTSRRIAVFECPSDPYSPGPYSYSGNMAYATTDAYRTSYSVLYPVYNMGTSYGAYTGLKAAFGHNGAAQFRDFKDGTSNSFVMMETPLEKQSAIRGPFWTCYVATGPVIPSLRRINQPYSATDLRVDWGTPGSEHEGGCHVLMGDGAVRFASENIDFNIQKALATIGGGEVVDDF